MQISLPVLGMMAQTPGVMLVRIGMYMYFCVCVCITWCVEDVRTKITNSKIRNDELVRCAAEYVDGEEGSGYHVIGHTPSQNDDCTFVSNPSCIPINRVVWTYNIIQ